MKYVILLLLCLNGCAAQVEYVDRWHEAEPISLYHPQVPEPPSNPELSIKVITEDTIKPGAAYVGFEYNEWLSFAKWMHSYKTYNKKLLNVIDQYEAQDATEDATATTK